MTDYDPYYIPNETYYIVGQKAIITREDDAFLLLKRSDKCSAGGQWSLPGGALEGKEDPYEGIEREIMEETRLNVTHLKPYYVVSTTKNTDQYVIIIGYTGTYASGIVTLNWEHDEYAWVTKEQALTYNCTPHGKIFIEQWQ